jgi:LPXTG-motif cell wall-anchored protein
MAGSGFSLSGDSHAQVSAAQDSGANSGVTFGAVYDGGPATLAVAGQAAQGVISTMPWYAWVGIAAAVVVAVIFLRRK